MVLYRVGMICSPGTCHGHRREGIVKLLGLLSLPGVASESMGMPARQPNGPSTRGQGVPTAARWEEDIMSTCDGEKVHRDLEEPGKRPAWVTEHLRRYVPDQK